MRMLVAALLAPALPMALVCLVVVSGMLFAAHGFSAPFHWPRSSSIFKIWGMLAVAGLLLGVTLRLLRRARLRHHLLTVLGTGAAIHTIVWWVQSAGRGRDEVLSLQDPEVAIAPPVDLHSDWTECVLPIDFHVFQAMAGSLILSTGAAALKWVAYGPDRPANPGVQWRIAGVIYVAAVIAVLIGMFGDVSGRFSGC